MRTVRILAKRVESRRSAPRRLPSSQSLFLASLPVDLGKVPIHGNAVERHDNDLTAVPVIARLRVLSSVGYPKGHGRAVPALDYDTRPFELVPMV